MPADDVLSNRTRTEWKSARFLYLEKGIVRLYRRRLGGMWQLIEADEIVVLSCGFEEDIKKRSFAFQSEACLLLERETKASTVELSYVTWTFFIFTVTPLYSVY